MSDRLNIIEIENPEPKATSASFSKKRREELKAKFDKIWLEDADKFNTDKNCLERERVRRTLNLILSHFNPTNKEIVDLGCGTGKIAVHLSTLGARVHCVDISNVALSYLEEKKYERISTHEDYVPRTLLKDESYDLVISTDLIEHLHPEDYRLYFSELSRLMKQQGSVVCSTRIDFNSEDALQKFATLAETEFHVHKWVLSHHAYYIKIWDIISTPLRYIRASKNTERRKKELDKRASFDRWLFSVNSSVGPIFLWSYVNDCINPWVKSIKHSRVFMFIMEKLCKNFANDCGVSHAIFMATHRPLIEEPLTKELPREKKERRTVWE